MVYFIKRSIVWLRRIRYSRGFGVHSPWAYKFIRYVINEHYPYYKYNDLEELVYGLDRRTRKLCKLYFRLVNYLQPDFFLDFFPSSPCYRFYVTAACKKVSYQQINHEFSFDDVNDKEHLATKCCVAHIPLRNNYQDSVDCVLNNLSSDSVLVLEGIKKDKDTNLFWKKLIKDSRVGVTFDLYYCGIVFLKTNMTKQNYIVNY